MRELEQHREALTLRMSAKYLECLGECRYKDQIDRATISFSQAVIVAYSAVHHNDPSALEDILSYFTTQEIRDVAEMYYTLAERSAIQNIPGLW